MACVFHDEGDGTCRCDGLLVMVFSGAAAAGVLSQPSDFSKYGEIERFNAYVQVGFVCLYSSTRTLVPGRRMQSTKGDYYIV